MSISFGASRSIALVSLVAVLAARAVGAQEGIGSDLEEYFDFLALSGLAERPTLTYATLSDNAWKVDDSGHPWDGYLGGVSSRALGPVTFRLYGPETFASYNTAYPHGTNDGSLFQGVGLNSSLSTGIRAEAFGFELTLKPTLCWEQNKYYDILPGAYESEYSSFWAIGIDTPQRFGDEPNFRFDWGDSEVRWGIGTFTVGFGTQAIWLGPARFNPILMSNNAAPFPKLDIGLQKTPTAIGDFEARAFWGYLRESEYFDEDPTNDGRLITGLALAWAPKFLPGLTLGINRTMQSRWDAWDVKGFFSLLWPFMSDDLGWDQRDQRATFIIQYLIPSFGFDCYAEWGRNDYSPTLDFILRYPFHTQGYSIGFRKSLTLGRDLKGLIEAEITNLESSRDYEFIGPTTFYCHGIIPQGYTNDGQIIGAGIGTGSNSQYLGFSLYYPRGCSTFSIQRINRNNDYVYFLHFGGSSGTKRADEYKFNTELTLGLETKYWLSKAFLGTIELDYCHNLNTLYDPTESHSSVLRNLRITIGFSTHL